LRGEHVKKPFAIVAIAACSFKPEKDEHGLWWVQVTPAGRFYPSDGRELKVDGWYIDAAIANKVIERFNKKRTELVLDYEHQTLYKEKNGQPAPAAGWFKQLQWREGKGLFAQVDLTSKATAEVEAKEYRYHSPVFTYDLLGNVVDVLMGALTNTPALEGMDELTKVAATLFLQPEDTNVDEFLKKLLSLLGLAEDATQEQILDAIGKLALAAEKKDETAETAAATAAVLGKIGTSLGLGDKASVEQITAACSALTTGKSSDKPDPAQFVPMSVFLETQKQVAALSAKQQGDEVERLIEKGTTEGKLTPAMTDWARDLGKQNIAQLSAFIASAPSIVALTKTQTQGKPPTENAHGLTAEELEAAVLTGLSVEDFATQKKETK